MFYLRHSAGLQGYFTNTNSSALSREIYFLLVLFSEYDGNVPRNLLLLFYFPSTTVLCRIAYFRTQACNVTLNPAIVFYLGKLPVDAAIHALIFRQVNRILYLKTYLLLTAAEKL